MTASNRNQTHVIGLFKIIIFVGYCSFVAIAKRKYVSSFDGLENLYEEGMTSFIVPKSESCDWVGSEVEMYAKFEITVLCVMSAPF